MVCDIKSSQTNAAGTNCKKIVLKAFSKLIWSQPTPARRVDLFAPSEKGNKGWVTGSQKSILV
jgi:hypothetical protein